MLFLLQIYRCLNAPLHPAKAIIFFADLKTTHALHENSHSLGKDKARLVGVVAFASSRLHPIKPALALAFSF
jgi:hypothetical protein